MAPPARRVDLRMTISVHDPYPGVAGELAEKFAEYAGAEAGAAKELGRDVEGSIAGAVPQASVELEMSSGDREVVVTVNAASAKKLTCPVPD
jgi:hypothetical protein